MSGFVCLFIVECVHLCFFGFVCASFSLCVCLCFCVESVTVCVFVCSYLSVFVCLCLCVFLHIFV